MKYVLKSRLWKAIRQNCIDCSGGSKFEVRHCVVNDCPLWPYRMGVAEAKRLGFSDDLSGSFADQAEKEAKTALQVRGFSAK
jgi:hypothetical protein